MQFIGSFFMEDALQDAFKAERSLLSWRKAAEQLCITSYKIMVHVILSYPWVTDQDVVSTIL